MARIRGGRKRPDKKMGRGHWKGRSATKAAELVNGMVNNVNGKIENNATSNADTKVRTYYTRQSIRAQERQARNQQARRKRGHKNGYQMKPVGPSGFEAGTYHA